MSTLDAIVDQLHAAGVAGFTYDPDVHPPVATVKCANVGGPDVFFASCRPCWWWDEDDDPGSSYHFTAASAQVAADAHNATHHPEGAPCPTS